jgi:hypothetical protein
VPSRRGSWPVLLALATAFVLLFYWQRSRSTFLLIEQERPAAVELAGRAGVDVADVLALRDMIGLGASASEWEALVNEFASWLRRVPAASQPLDRHAEPVWKPQLSGRPFAAGKIAPDALAARRFLLLRERFAARR